MPRALDLDLLNTLVVVADSGSLSAAASRLYRSHSAVGERLRKLEQVCGLSLMVRGKMGASLTPAGERLVVHARKILALSDAALRDLHDAESSRELRLAVTDYFRPHALPGIFERIGAQFPQLRLRVALRNSALIEEQTHTGTFDIGLSMRVLHDEYSLDVAPGERRMLGCEPMHWVADKSFVLPDGVPLPLIVLPETCSLQRFVIRMLDEHRIAYSIAHSATNIGGLHLALAAGLGVACLNASAIPSTAAPFEHHMQLPQLPEAEFSLVPPRCGEPSFVSGVREMLAEHLS
ncbi:LysR substrate-binding domain-containing protein [Paraburkholderia hospita]|uniref:LysR substrate-binding domain-containing protein n=1 Tax=Paraburkholderia hospita TaxID=169430 RepID=UPI000DEF0A78|nr:LysR substrate-binding domain-containing protein [Paraburkholderia hospita]AXF03236.1 LysR family transcriptional regulator [Paraburkholderia hospita]